MGKLRRILARDWPLLMISLILLAGGLAALATPVLLGDYDRFGMQIDCGNGYHSDLTQAEIDDREPQPPPSAGPSATAVPAGHGVEHCRAAITHRRAWAIPAAALGFAMLIPGLVKWARAEPAPPATGRTPWSTTHPDQAMHEAAVLDRRSHRNVPEPDDTTP